MYQKLSPAVTFVAIGHLTIELCNNYLPVIYPIWIKTLGLTYTQVGAMAFVAGTSVSLAQPLFGALSDRWQPARMVVLSVVWLGLTMGLLAWFILNHRDLNN